MENEKTANKQFIAFVKRHASLMRFVFTGGLNTLIDFTLFALIANIIGVNPILASIISTGLTLIFSYFMNHYFVFRSQRKRRQTALQFLLVTLFNVWVIQSGIIFIVLHTFGFVQFFQEHEWTFNMFAKLCGVAVSMVFNYVGYKMIFNEKSNDSEQKD
ncbi:MAG TPA: GtrA family protein [Candidatus Saccharimonadales bacterium]|nr:GtrA family protein [Candidatus Saccharimonadales bacterium]